MSLLMDALKKAEQEKKEAAKRQQEVRDGGGPDQEAAPAEKLNTTLEHEVPVETGDAKAARAGHDNALQYLRAGTGADYKQTATA